MPKLVGVRERRHQPYYDTLCRTDVNVAANPVVNQQTRLFNGTNLGQLQWTNMVAASQFGSDNTYIILALRVWLWFTGGTGSLTCYQLAVHQMFCQLTIGDKTQFTFQAWYAPSGGGIFGFDSVTPSMVNGVPTQEATLKLAKPIPIPARQNFNVIVDLFDTGATSLRTTFLNTAGATPMKEIKVLIDGIHTRDVL